MFTAETHQTIAKKDKTLKGIINPKNQFFMQNTNFIPFGSTRAFLDLFFRNIFSAENRKSQTQLKTHIFLLTFLLFLQTI